MSDKEKSTDTKNADMLTSALDRIAQLEKQVAKLQSATVALFTLFDIVKIVDNTELTMVKGIAKELAKVTDELKGNLKPETLGEVYTTCVTVEKGTDNFLSKLEEILPEGKIKEIIQELQETAKDTVKKEGE